VKFKLQITVHGTAVSPYSDFSVQLLAYCTLEISLEPCSEHELLGHPIPNWGGTSTGSTPALRESV